jgi:MoaA/NifB/PqqE/SkfB family radical SAM enzyme
MNYHKLKPLQSLVLKNKIPGQLIIQITDQCNAHCPQCGMRCSEKFDRSTIAPDAAKRIIDSAAAKGVESISFTGGEPFLELELLVELIDYASKAGIRFIRTGTNGFYLRDLQGPYFRDRICKIADLLASTGLRNLWISIDSSDPAMHESIRGLSGVISGIEKALPIFHERGIYPAANLGINRAIGGQALIYLAGNTRKPEQERENEFYYRFLGALNNYYNYVINMGFTMVNACYPMSTDESDRSINAVYAADSQARIVRFSPQEKGLVFKAVLDAIPAYRHRIRIFSPQVSLYSLWNRYSNNIESSYPCRGGTDFFFVDSKNCNTYPCGYRGSENLGKFWNLDIDSLREANCRKCDWECFRDPSEIFGPVLHAITSPVGFVRGLIKNKTALGLWLEDLRYFNACGLFNGRVPPDYSKLRKFAQNDFTHAPNFNLATL